MHAMFYSAKELAVLAKAACNDVLEGGMQQVSCA
jgi:hypothetical protein